MEKGGKIRISAQIDEALMRMVEGAMDKLGMSTKSEFFRMALKEKSLRVLEGKA
jgi:metal-responsive CopG/Arc/MetJ family transcriptional regulator